SGSDAARPFVIGAHVGVHPIRWRRGSARAGEVAMKKAAAGATRATHRGSTGRTYRCPTSTTKKPRRGGAYRCAGEDSNLHELFAHKALKNIPALTGVFSPAATRSSVGGRRRIGRV